MWEKKKLHRVFNSLDWLFAETWVKSWRMLLLLLLSRFSRVRLCVTPEMAAHQAPPSLGFSRQEHWSGWNPAAAAAAAAAVASVVSDSVRPHRQQPTRLPCPWDSPGKNTGVGCHFLLQCMKVKSESEVAQSCPTLSYPMDCSPPGSSVHGIFQARVLEWGAIAFSAWRMGRVYFTIIIAYDCAFEECTQHFTCIILLSSQDKWERC